MLIIISGFRNLKKTCRSATCVTWEGIHMKKDSANESYFFVLTFKVVKVI